jgi:hypothetical protein
MTKIQMVTIMQASTATIWDILTDSSYVPKLFPDVVGVVVDPPGRNFVGQKFHLIGRAGRRRLDIFAETIELVTEKKVLTRNRPGGLFKSAEHMVLLDPRGPNTEVKTSFQYELSMGYLGQVFNIVILERLVSDNLKAYTHNLKEICELVPIHA